MNQNILPILTITGSDSTSGSGVQADLKTITELGGYALTAITSITVQTTLGIQEIHDLPPHIVEGQIEAVMNDVPPVVVKIGLVRRRDVLEVLVAMLRRYRPRHVVYAPVGRSAHGDELLTDDQATAIRQMLLPLCTLVIAPDAKSTHGQTNRYASAVAVFLAQGHSPEEATAMARRFVSEQEALQGTLQGRGPELYRDFVDAVEQHHRTNSDVRFYADRLNVSSRYLAQVTRRIARQSPKAIIDDCLLRHIKQELGQPKLSVKEVAYGFGFSSQAHFTKFFRKLTGLTPTQFRQH